MAIETVQDAQDQYTAIEGSYTDALAILRQAPLAPSDAAEGLRALQATLDLTTGLLTDLAAVDETTLIAVDSAPNLIRIWLWRREFRNSVLTFSYDLRRLTEDTEEFVRGYQDRVVFVTEGETLQAIAQRELGDFKAWVDLVARNPGLSPIELEPGTPIVIPTRR